jgi:hypothetical protein
LSFPAWQEVKKNKVEISSIPLCLDPHIRRLNIFMLCGNSLSERIKKKFKDKKLFCNKGMGKEVRRAGERKMLAIKGQGGERKSEVSFGRIASVSVPPNGNKEESEEPCRHSEAPF